MTHAPLHRDPRLIPLSHQHQHGLAISVLIDRGLKAEPTAEKARELALKVARLAEAELLEHFRIEEEILFPEVRPVLERGELVDSLVAEHRLMEELLRAIAAARGEEAIPCLKEFGAVLHRHIRTEERQLFEEIQRAVDEAGMAELGRRIEARIQTACPLGARLPWADA